MADIGFLLSPKRLRNSRVGKLSGGMKTIQHPAQRNLQSATRLSRHIIVPRLRS